MESSGLVSVTPRLIDARRRFEMLVEATEVPLRRALVAAYGHEAGREATAEALAWAWEHLDKVEALENPGGYLWRVGQTAARRGRRWAARHVDIGVPESASSTVSPIYEPALRRALAALTSRQRAAVLLVHGWGDTLEAAAEALGCEVSTLRNHLTRGLAKLRQALGAIHD